MSGRAFLSQEGRVTRTVHDLKSFSHLILVDLQKWSPKTGKSLLVSDSVHTPFETAPESELSQHCPRPKRSTLRKTGFVYDDIRMICVPMLSLPIHCCVNPLHPSCGPILLLGSPSWVSLGYLLSLILCPYILSFIQIIAPPLSSILESSYI